MKNGFYPRLAMDSIRKNSRLYIPYALTCQLCVCMFYLMYSLSENRAICEMRGGGTVTLILKLGCVVLGVFSILFLFYTNAFLIRRRKKEFGLYCVLGMDRHSVGRVLRWETLLTAAASLFAGLVFGIALSKLGELLLIRMTGGTAGRGFFVSGAGVLLTLALFGFIFLLLYLNDVRQVRFSTVASLLRAARTGEKPPRANYVFALLGLALLGTAYWMAVSIRQPLTALLLFFAAVLLVIAATYLLMISGSVALCRVLQKRKNYYYRTRHFVSVSSMTFRMKRNGAGLASICVLATMVLVMISATACLFFGAEDSLHTRYPRQIDINVQFDATASRDDRARLTDTVRGTVGRVAGEAGIAPENILDSRRVELTGVLMGDTAVLDPDAVDGNALLYDDMVVFSFLDVNEYNASARTPVTVPRGKLMVYSPRYPVNEGRLLLGNTEYSVLRAPEEVRIYSQSDVNVMPVIYLLCEDPLAALAPLNGLRDLNGDLLLRTYWDYCFDTALPAAEQREIWQALTKELPAAGVNCCVVSWREGERDDFYGTYGGFFFLGLMLSFVFLAAAAIIIYYKQLSEGYEDQGRFAILRKLGMTRKDIRKSVDSQMLIVFFFPLGMAILHLCFAFPMLRKMLLLFGLNNLPLLLLTAAISTAVFALFYGLVYRVTAGVYYELAAFGGEESLPAGR